MNKQLHILIAKFSFALPFDIDFISYANQIALDLINQLGFRDKKQMINGIRKELIHSRNEGLNRYRVHYLITLRFDPQDFDLILDLVEQSMDKLFEQALIQSRDIVLIKQEFS